MDRETLSREEAGRIAGIASGLTRRTAVSKRDARVSDLRKRGLSLAEIAAKVGISRQRVSQILQRDAATAA